MTMTSTKPRPRRRSKPTSPLLLDRKGARGPLYGRISHDEEREGLGVTCE